MYININLLSINKYYEKLIIFYYCDYDYFITFTIPIYINMFSYFKNKNIKIFFVLFYISNVYIGNILNTLL